MGYFRTDEIFEKLYGYDLVATSQVDVSAANAEARITLPAEVGKRHIVSGLAWSYDSQLSDGRLHIYINNDANMVVFDIDIISSGPGFIPFTKQFDTGLQVDIVLQAGGAGVVGKLNVLNYMKVDA